MTPEAVREQRDALRRAGERLRRRPFDDTLAVLARVLDAWSDPESSYRRRLEAELPGATGFSPQTVREGLALALSEWSGDALTTLAHRELPRPVEGAATTAVILAGSIPMPSLLSIVAPLALRSPVLVKCASRDTVTPRLVARSLIDADRELGECIALLDVRGDAQSCIDALLEAECVLATGSDETIAALRERMSDPQRLVAHGHRLSLAALGPQACSAAALPGVAAALARDVALWDQLGCLSPLAVYVPRDCVVPVGDALAEALARLERVLPRGSIDARSAAAIAAERSEAELRGAAGHATRVLAGSGTSWTVVCEAVAAVRPAPLHRFLRIFPVTDAAALLETLRPYASHLAGVALAGFGAAEPDLTERLRALGASRVCAPGRLQAPPLDWRRDGHSVLASLAPAPV
ncbi:MAG: hypothetical protein JRG84_20445 [Deltaproteobacteria bacterium]|nr:hypothetical protein [Deltaproteobacteria bacterium]